MQIKGINLGGWLLMEGYILGGRNISETKFKRDFLKTNGRKELKNFERAFRSNFIDEEDFKNIKSFGFNSIRLPFHYKIAEKDNLEYLKDAFKWASKYGIKIILDLHAAKGSQNQDWHSDSDGKANLWLKKSFRIQTVKLWEKIATIFKDEDALLGYDILNEPVIKDDNTKIIADLYSEIIKAIRSVDKKHIIFLEGDIWAQRIDFLKDLIAENIQISIHTYQPLDYTFNFVPFYKYPGKICNVDWDKSRMQKYLEPYYNFSSKNNVKIYVGEFGINWRGGFFGEGIWLSDILKLFDEFGFGWSYWTYKAVAQFCFPDGLYQYIQNSKFIRREGPIYGWENYILYWKDYKNQIIEFWKTKNFVLNKTLLEILQNFTKQ